MKGGASVHALAFVEKCARKKHGHAAPFRLREEEFLNILFYNTILTWKKRTKRTIHAPNFSR